MSSVSIAFEPAAPHWQPSRPARLLRRAAAFLRWRNYPRQRRLRREANLRWLSEFSRHQH